MVSGFSSPKHLSWLTLLCASMIVLAWAAPLLVDVLPDSHPTWPLSSSQAVIDPHDMHTHLGELLDEPLIFTSLGSAILHQLRSSCVAARPTTWAWTALPLLHPPSVLNSN